MNPVVQMDMVESDGPTAEQQFDQASATKDPKALLEVAKNNFDTPVGQAAMGLANHLYKTSKEFDALVGPIVKAGGPDTPQGRLEAVKVFESSKTDPTLGEVLMHYFTGNAAYARDLVTGGKVTTEIRPDKNGRMVKVWSNAFGPMRARELGSNTDLSEQEFQDRAVGRQKYEDTLTYLTGKQVSEDNNKEWQSKIKRDSETEQTYRSQIDPLAKRMLSDLQDLPDIDPAKRAEMLRYINYSISQASRSGESNTTLSQAQANADVNAGKEVGSKTAVSLGLPVGKNDVYRWTKDGIENATTKESYSWNRLNSLQSTTNRSNEIDNRYNTDRESMIKYLRASKMDKEQQDRVLRVYDTSKELGKSLLSIHGKENAPKFLFTPNVSESDDPYTLIQGKMAQLLTNGNLIKMQAEYAGKAYREAKESGGIMPSPYEIEAGFSRTRAFKDEVNKGMQMTEQLISETARRGAERQQRQQSAAGPVQPPAQGGVAPIATQPSREQVAMPSVKPEAKAQSASFANRGAPTLPPEGMVQVGIDPKTGRPVFDKRGK